jgi:hypothetical protein
MVGPQAVRVFVTNTAWSSEPSARTGVRQTSTDKQEKATLTVLEQAALLGAGWAEQAAAAPAPE